MRPLVRCFGRGQTGGRDPCAGSETPGSTRFRGNRAGSDTLGRLSLIFGEAVFLWRVLRRTKPALLAALLPLLLALALPLETLAESPGDGSASRRSYIVTLNVADAGEAIRPAGRANRQRIRRRASLTAAATDRLAAAHGFKTRHRYASAVSGFSARLTAQQAARLRRDPSVSVIRPARRFRIAAQQVTRNVQRVKAAPGGSPAPDVDADIAVLDTGIGPVGGNELNIAGGINCSGDGLGADVWRDLHPSRHGTHVAGIAAARDNDVGIVGVAPGARLWSVRVFRQSGYGDEATIVCGLDWAVATHGPAAPANTQPIETINMSIQGTRIGGGPEECVGAGDPDPIHVGVCAAYAANMTVVVAAGNERADTDGVSPAGYDQVITVAALSDFDGVGGGASSSDCGLLPNEKDDVYATYSNHGDDVDILAPGTCVLSTLPSADGTATQRLSGTSMATPHVTGAVARYLAVHPGTGPAMMRKLVRASGRLDWNLTTDPHWFGPNDSDQPNRVLDVAALMGSPGLRAWIFPGNFRVGGTSTTRTARVDVQRIGGFDGQVDLSLSGLPAAMGSGSFDRPGTPLTGLNGLGARLVMDFPTSGSEGRPDVEVNAEAQGGSPSGARAFDLVVDRTGPVSMMRPARPRGERVAIRKGRAIPVWLEWTASDALSEVVDGLIQRRLADGPWRAVGSPKTGTRASASVRPGRTYRFRVRTRDSLGNRGYSDPVLVRLIVRDSRSSTWQFPGRSWRTVRNRNALGGSLLMWRPGSGRLVTSFNGTAVAIVAPVGPRRGSIRMRVDGGPWRTISLRASRNGHRRVVFSRRLPPTGNHTIEIQRRTGRPAIDAILVIR